LFFSYVAWAKGSARERGEKREERRERRGREKVERGEEGRCNVYFSNSNM
jgi:hypothetical protein